MNHKRIVVSRYGGPEVLEVSEEELQDPRDGEIRVKVLAAGVAWGDILRRQGLGLGARLPFTPGYDIVGIVEKTGANVSGVETGQMVAALSMSGGYAEYRCLPASELVPVPAGLDPADAVCLVMNYVVAHQMLHRAARVRTGERVLVLSAAGGVGTALLQLGALFGLKMYGTASRGKHELITRLGATSIDYRTENVAERILDLTGDGVDAVFDPIGGSHIRQSYRMLRKGGRLVVYGAHTIMVEGKLKAIAGFMLAPLLNLIPDGRSILTYGITRPKYSQPAWCREDLSRMFGLLEAGEIKPVIAERIPLEEAARAHQVLESGAATGKIVLLTS